MWIVLKPVGGRNDEPGFLKAFTYVGYATIVPRFAGETPPLSSAAPLPQR